MTRLCDRPQGTAGFRAQAHGMGKVRGQHIIAKPGCHQRRHLPLQPPDMWVMVWKGLPSHLTGTLTSALLGTEAASAAGVGVLLITTFT